MAETFDPSHADQPEDPERLVELPPARLVELLRLTGMCSIPLTAAVPLGRVLAVDEQPRLLSLT